MRLRSALKYATAAALVDAYLRHRRRRSARGHALIHVLGYHRIVDRVVEDGPVMPSLCVSIGTFRRQMEQVKNEFQVLTFEAALDALEGAPLERDACVVTFDDGYRDVYTHAAPILDELEIPATLFVPSGFIGTDRRFAHDRLYAAMWKLGEGHPAELVDTLIARLPAAGLEAVATLLETRAGPVDDETRVVDAAELRALADAGWEIGSHTIDHAVLTHEAPEHMEDQLLLPKIDIEAITGRPCRYFAYCNGFHSPSLVEALARCGYQGAVTTCDRPNRRGGDRFRLYRKVLWEGHARGYDGNWSPQVSAANLHDLFGALGLTRPVDGEVECAT